MVSFILPVVLLFVTWITYNAHCAVTNYRKAVKLDLPIVICPVSPDNPLWMAIQTIVGGLLKNIPLPAAISNLKYCTTGWEFSDRYYSHEKFGDAWVLVTPAWVWLYVANADTVADIFARGKDFKRPVFMMEALNVFGPSVGTVEGQDWQRQRKLTAPSLNETKMSSVWDESLSQASEMLQSWTSQPQGFNTTEDDTRTLALHVLAYAAFKKTYPYSSRSKDESDIANSMTYRDSISIILHNALIILALPHAMLSWSFMPAGLRRIGQALAYFRQYMVTQIENEKELLKTKSSGSGSVVSSYVRASDENIGAMKPLTEAEMLGNIFLLNFAGHDTTALTLSYGMALLAVYPEVQDWIYEEISLYGHEPNSYETSFPRMTRTLAVLFETLRLYDPIPGVPKFVDEHSTAELTVNDKTYFLGPKTLVVPNMQASHTHPRHWGQDSLQWRPQRWIVTPGPDASIQSEELFTPRKGTFFPFAEGMRSCLGKKFAQVEWVATLMTLFKGHTVEPVIMSGENMEQARKRTLDVVKDSNLKLLLSMRNPHNVVLRWKKRTR